MKNLLVMIITTALTLSSLRPWFTHGTSLIRDRALLNPLAILHGRFVPVTAAANSFTAAVAGSPGRKIVTLSHANLPDKYLDTAEHAWIGRRQSCGTDYYALAMEQADVLAALSRSKSALLDVQCQPLRDVADVISCADEAAIMSTARGYMHFHSSNRFCAKCGTPTVSTKAGAARVCTSATCGHKVYPRVDPAAIVLVTSPQSVDGGRHALLGRKKSWPKGRFSTLSGFAELGETIEEALCREVFEESGIIVRRDSLRFACSQPWLFPQSLMLGFLAEAEPCPTSPRSLPAISADDDELERCEWFSREYVRDRLGGGSISLVADTSGTAAAEFHIPGHVSLANTLITEWAGPPNGADA